MKINHNLYSNLAFNLADKNLGKTNKNPSVGCVIVKNNYDLFSSKLPTNSSKSFASLKFL